MKKALLLSATLVVLVVAAWLGGFIDYLRFGAIEDCVAARALNAYAVLEKGLTNHYSDLIAPASAEKISLMEEKAREMVAKHGSTDGSEGTENGDAAVATINFEDGTQVKLDLVKVDGKGKWKLSNINMDEVVAKPQSTPARPSAV
jgi:hypothetical protein